MTTDGPVSPRTGSRQTRQQVLMALLARTDDRSAALLELHSDGDRLRLMRLAAAETEAPVRLELTLWGQQQQGEFDLMPECASGIGTGLSAPHYFVRRRAMEARRAALDGLTRLSALWLRIIGTPAEPAMAVCGQVGVLAAAYVALSLSTEEAWEVLSPLGPSLARDAALQRLRGDIPSLPPAIRTAWTQALRSESVTRREKNLAVTLGCRILGDLFRRLPLEDRELARAVAASTVCESLESATHIDPVGEADSRAAAAIVAHMLLAKTARTPSREPANHSSA